MITGRVTLTETEAARLTQRIELRLTTIADNTEAVIPMIEEARTGNAHEALGYRSWTQYVTEKFGGALGRLGKVERLPFVEMMADQGMSTRAIGDVVGVSKDTVSRDLRAGVSDETPEPTACPDCRGALELPSTTCFNRDHVNGGLMGQLKLNTEPKKTTGLDGKTYTRPEPKPPRRRPLPDAYWRAAYDLQKAVEKVSRLHRDDRFASNRESVKQSAPEIARAANELLSLLDDLGIDRHKYGGTS